MNQKLKKIRCSRCGYFWNTKSQLKRVTCPNCGKTLLRGIKELFNRGG